MLVRRGCVRSSDGTPPFPWEAILLAPSRGSAPWERFPGSSFSQLPSVELVDVEEIELCDEMPSREKTEEVEEAAEEAMEDA